MKIELDLDTRELGALSYCLGRVAKDIDDGGKHDIVRDDIESILNKLFAQFEAPVKN